jgi:hypothetical protein
MNISIQGTVSLDGCAPDVRPLSRKRNRPGKITYERPADRSSADSLLLEKRFSFETLQLKDVTLQ